MACFIPRGGVFPLTLPKQVQAARCWLFSRIIVVSRPFEPQISPGLQDGSPTNGSFLCVVFSSWCPACHGTIAAICCFEQQLWVLQPFLQRVSWSVANESLPPGALQSSVPIPDGFSLSSYPCSGYLPCIAVALTHTCIRDQAQSHLGASLSPGYEVTINKHSVVLQFLMLALGTALCQRNCGSRCSGWGESLMVNFVTSVLTSCTFSLCRPRG